MKKDILVFLFTVFVLTMVGCGEQSGATFEATILEITDSSYLVEPVEGSAELKSADQIMVAMKNLDPSLEPEVGDIIKIKYNGTIMETYPAQISDVLSIKVIKEAEHWALVPMVMINGELYLDTGYNSTIDVRCGMMDGEITSEVEGWEKPTKDNQANFGAGYSYQYGSTEGTIEIYMNDNWRIFATEEVRQKIQFPTENTETMSFNDKIFNKSELSQEIVEWLEEYNNLSEEEQLAISYIPPDLYALCGYPTAEEVDADEIITYNGKEYEKSELCDATLHWLELSEQERMLSSYLPPEFLGFTETLGVTLTAENITPTSATLKCVQSGGEPTGELHTGSWYILETWTQKDGWKEMSYVIDEEIGWTSEVWMIPMENSCEWEVNWEWLYGELPVGKYRIGKEIMDFRGPGDFDKTIYFTEFEIIR